MAKLDYVIVDLLQSTARNIKAQPVNLGGIAGGGGGVGGPPGGFIGWLPQTRVAYDTDEIASSGITNSGTLLDNLNHIRYRIQNLESGILVVDEFDGVPTVSGVNRVTFSGGGVSVTDAGGGRVIVSITASGGGGGIPEAPVDGQVYGRQSSSWTDLDTVYLRLDTDNIPLTGTVWTNSLENESFIGVQNVAGGNTTSASTLDIIRNANGTSPFLYAYYDASSYAVDILDANPFILFSGGTLLHRRYDTTILTKVNPYAEVNSDVAIFNSFNAITASGTLIRLQNQGADKFVVDGEGTVDIPTGQTYNINGTPHLHDGHWELIEEKITSGDVASLDFQSIPATYRNLIIIAYARTDQAGASDNVVVRFNNDSGNNYYALRTNIAHSASVTTVEQLATGAAGLFSCAGDNAPANFFAPAYMVIPAYANTSNHKTTRAFGFTHGATTTGNQVQRDASGVWKDTSAINRITLSPSLGSNFKAGTRVYLYGA